MEKQTVQANSSKPTVLGWLGRYFFHVVQDALHRRWLYQQRQAALEHLFQTDATTLARVGLSHEELRWEARLPLKNNTATQLETWRKLGLIP